MYHDPIPIVINEIVLSTSLIYRTHSNAVSKFIAHFIKYKIALTYGSIPRPFALQLKK